MADVALPDSPKNRGGIASEPARPETARSLLLTVVDGLVGGGTLVAVEMFGLLVGRREELSGPWEAREAVLFLLPLAWLAVLPFAALGSVALVLVERGRIARGVLAVAAFAFASWVCWSVSTGRHLSWMPLRVGFVVATASVGAGLVWLLAPHVASKTKLAPLWTGLAATLLAAVLELANLVVLPRLYLGFHVALAVLAAALAPLVALALRPARISAREAKWRTILGVALAVGLLGRARPSAHRLALADNLRRMALERAPLAAQGVALATLLAPPPPLTLPDEEAPIPQKGGSSATGRGGPSWQGRNLLLVTADAVRADHVGAYGYSRRTTPEIDAIAATGVLFERAYCPTPHTSYSVVSLMTGKNMRPLLLQGLGADSDTWAGLLRRYGYRTAAFYPPAVFFIDGERFLGFRDRRLDFEFARVEFANPDERANAVQRYLDGAGREKPLFLWVHLFEPHEPYVAHPEHPFGDRDIDRYDSEIAYTDAGIGALVRRVRAALPNTVVMIASDHGEEFGDHGGHYHGTTVYEEQVRVPLILQAPGLLPIRRVDAPVQTIDLLPTVLSVLDIPKPARVRGHSLVPLLLASASAPESSAPDHASAGSVAERPGNRASFFAFSETDEQTMLARGSERLVCMRRASACALYDLTNDPTERHDLGPTRPEQFLRMKQELRRFEASHGRFESSGLLREGGGSWPAALRRAIAGDGDAAQDVAPLLDDADVRVRRKAAEVLFDLARSEATPALRLAQGRDEDAFVQKWCIAALARSSPEAADWSSASTLLTESRPELRRAGALVLAEHGDGRGAPLLLEWLAAADVPFERSRQIVVALGRARAGIAISALTHLLADVRLGPDAAAALAAIGQPSARPALLDQLAKERYQNARVALVRSLVLLGAKQELAAPLARWLGTPDPLPSGLAFALEAGILGQIGGPTEADLLPLQPPADPTAVPAPPSATVRLQVRIPAGGNGAGCRLIARGASVGASGSATFEEVSRETARSEPLAKVTMGFPSHVVQELAERWPSTSCAGRSVWLRVQTSGVRLDALALVPLEDELPPPPPQPWTPEEDRPDRDAPGPG